MSETYAGGRSSGTQPEGRYGMGTGRQAGGRLIAKAGRSSSSSAARPLARHSRYGSERYQEAESRAFLAFFADSASSTARSIHPSNMTRFEIVMFNNCEPSADVDRSADLDSCQPDTMFRCVAPITLVRLLAQADGRGN
jgi:hypothetical protein